METDHPPIQPVEVLNRTTRIVMWAMAIVMVCISLVMVIIVLNERSTQRNADVQTLRNEELTQELRCLRAPNFDVDKNNSEINIVLARALAALGQGDDEKLFTLVPELTEEADQLEGAIQALSNAITSCQATGGG